MVCVCVCGGDGLGMGQEGVVEGRWVIGWVQGGECDDHTPVNSIKQTDRRTDRQTDRDRKVFGGRGEEGWGSMRTLLL